MSKLEELVEKEKQAEEALLNFKSENDEEFNGVYELHEFVNLAKNLYEISSEVNSEMKHCDYNEITKYLAI